MTNTVNMVFSESTNKTGMYEWFQDLTGANTASYSAYKFARDANNALLDYQMLALKANGGWQFDDFNQVAAAEKTINLVSGTVSYAILVDDETNANQIIEIERVECAIDAAASNYNVLTPYDEMAQGSSILYDRTLSGIPSAYYIKGNTLYLDRKPSFSSTSGLKIFISRTTTYFAGTDTTKVAGIPHAHQKYLVLKAAYEYCAVNVPTRANGIFILLQQAEREITKHFSQRNKDLHRSITMRRISGK